MKILFPYANVFIVEWSHEIARTFLNRIRDEKNAKRNATQGQKKGRPKLNSMNVMGEKDLAGTEL